MAKTNSKPASQKIKINKNMVLSACEGTREFLDNATCNLSILNDAINRILESAEEKKVSSFVLESEIEVLAGALKFLQDGFSEPYSNLCSWIKTFEEGELG